MENMAKRFSKLLKIDEFNAIFLVNIAPLISNDCFKNWNFNETFESGKRFELPVPKEFEDLEKFYKEKFNMADKEIYKTIAAALYSTLLFAIQQLTLNPKMWIILDHLIKIQGKVTKDNLSKHIQGFSKEPVPKKEQIN